MKQWFGLLLLLWSAMSPAQVLADEAASTPREDTALVFGVLPFASPVALFRRFTPLTEYLGDQLHRVVVVETARDFPEFVRRTRDRRYDIVLTAPHFVLLALDTGRYEVRATYLKPLSARVVVRKDSRIRSVAELAGEVVATPPREAIISMVGKQYLIDAGLGGKRAPVYHAYRTHNAAYHAVLGGEAEAAIVSVNVLNRALKEGRSLRSIGHSGDFPALGILVAKDLPQALRDKIARSLIGMRATAKGRRVLSKIAYPGYRPATPSDFESLRKFLR
jgi:phosphonate transport system substrate-binding protein